jgi:hypothetical protein
MGRLLRLVRVWSRGWFGELRVCTLTYNVRSSGVCAHKVSAKSEKSSSYLQDPAFFVLQECSLCSMFFRRFRITNAPTARYRNLAVRELTRETLDS